MELVLTQNRAVGERQKTHFIRHFLNLKGSSSKYTAISYERDILDFFQVEKIEEITLEQIVAVNMFDVEHYLLDLKGKGCASATINRKVSSLSSLYKWLLKYQDNRTGRALLYFNPFGNLRDEKPKVNSKETEFLTSEECVKLLSVFDTKKILDLRNKTIMYLALTTALRKSELINIKLKDITLIDTPGFVSENNICNYIEIKKYTSLIPKKEIKPKVYNLRPGFMLLIRELIRIENNTDKNINLVLYLKNEINIEKMRVIRNNYLKDKEVFSTVCNNEDIVINGLGFIKVVNTAKIDIYVVNKNILSKRERLI